MASYLLKKQLIKREERFPFTLMLEPLELCNLACHGLRAHPRVRARLPQAAVRGGVPPRGRGGRRADRQHPRRRAADPQADRPDRQRHHGAGPLRLPVHQRPAHGPRLRAHPALQPLRLRGAHRRHARGARPRRRRARACSTRRRPTCARPSRRATACARTPRSSAASRPRSTCELFRFLREMGVEGCITSPGFDYESVTHDREQFLARQGGRGALHRGPRPLRGPGRALLQQPALPRVPAGQARVPLLGVVDADLHRRGLAEPVLPARRRARRRASRSSTRGPTGRPTAPAATRGAPTARCTAATRPPRSSRPSRARRTWSRSHAGDPDAVVVVCALPAERRALRRLERRGVGGARRRAWAPPRRPGRRRRWWPRRPARPRRRGVLRRARPGAARRATWWPPSGWSTRPRGEAFAADPGLLAAAPGPARDARERAAASPGRPPTGPACRGPRWTSRAPPLARVAAGGRRALPGPARGDRPVPRPAAGLRADRRRARPPAPRAGRPRTSSPHPRELPRLAAARARVRAAPAGRWPTGVGRSWRGRP